MAFLAPVLARTAPFWYSRSMQMVDWMIGLCGRADRDGGEARVGQQNRP